MLKATLRMAALAATVVLALPAAEVPRKAPELQIRMADGKDILLSSYRGKVIALEFLLTTCPHCQRASQTVNKLQREFGAKGFQPLGVAINDMANMLVVDYVKQFNLTYPVGYTHRDTAINFLQHPIMVSMMMPQLVIIDRQGMIRHQYAGNDKFFENEEKNLREIIAPLLSGAPAAAAKKK
jgi:peroxiredoxin